MSETKTTTKMEAAPTEAMTLNEYQVLARRTAKYQVGIYSMLVPLTPEKDFEALDRVRAALKITYTALGLTGEAGEFADQAKRIIRDDDGVLTESRREKMIKELGDCLWYLSQGAAELGVTLEEVARINIAKLQARAAQNKISGEGGSR